MRSHTTSGEKYDSARRKAAGIVWLCAVQFFIVQAVVESQWTTAFSLATNNISDLGNTACGTYPAVGGSYICSPWYVMMNMSFALQGMIIIAGSALALPLLEPSRTRSLIFWLLIVTGVTLIGVGAFPENVNNLAHVISAGIQFVTGNLGILILGLAMIRKGGSRLFGAVSASLGAAGLAATVLFGMRIDLALGLGTIERIAAYTLPIWLITAGTAIVIMSAGRPRKVELA